MAMSEIFFDRRSNSVFSSLRKLIFGNPKTAKTVVRKKTVEKSSTDKLRRGLDSIATSIGFREHRA